MLIDINAYVGHWPFQKLHYNTCKTLLQRMDAFGVNQSVVSNLNGIFYKNTQSANEELMEEIKSDPRFARRFVPLAVINPIYAGWKKDMETSIKKLGMKGVRLHPKYHDYEITDPACISAVKMARDLGVPVIFDIRMVDSRARSWMDIDYVVGTPKKEWTLLNILPIIREVPDAKYIVVNLANAAALSPADKELIKKTNMLIDTSGRTILSMNEYLEIYGADKFAFGTHAPILDYASGQLRIESLKPTEVDAATKERLRSGNAKKMLGI
jgi:predicted TIM-barrel fold metal-dependent hydrolase